MLETIMEIIKYAPEAIGALLMIIGGLKIIAKYTSTTWDDKALEHVERIAKIALSLFKKKIEKTEEKIEDEQG